MFDASERESSQKLKIGNNVTLLEIVKIRNSEIRSGVRTRRHFKDFEPGIHYISQNGDNQQARILPFSNFGMRV